MPDKKQVKFNLQTATCGKCEERSETLREAVSYCKTCQKFLCGECIKPHRKLVAMNNHAMLNRDHELNGLYYFNSYADTIAKVPEEIENTFKKYKEYRSRTMDEIEKTQKSVKDDVNDSEYAEKCDSFDISFYELCEKHPTMPIKYYCVFHEELCCDCCKILNHKMCLPNVKYIPDELQHENKTNIIDNFRRLISDFKEFDSCLQSDIKELKKSKQTFLFDLKEKKREILNWVNLMEVRAIRRLQIVFDRCKREIDKKRESTKKSCQELRTEMYFLKDILSNENHDGIYKYIKEKKACKTIKEVVEKREHRQFSKSRFSLKLNQDFESLKCSMDHLYEINFETKGENKFSVRLKNDVHRSNVTGCTIMDTGDVVLADRSNGKLKHLDMNFKTVKHLVVPGDIFDVTTVGHNSIAFTSPLKSEISITELRPTFEIVKTISTGDGSCWGVSYHEGLFVTNITTKDACLIKIVDIDSNELLKVDMNRQFYSTIRIDSDQTTMHVITTAAYEGKTTPLEHFIDVHENSIGNQKVKVSVYNYLNHLRTKGLVCNNYENIVVCCSDTDQIYTISKMGDEAELLLAESDGLCRPQSLCYSKDKTKLLVTSEFTDFIQIFRL